MRIFRKNLVRRIGIQSGIDATRWMLAAEGVFPSYLLFDNKQLNTSGAGGGGGHGSSSTSSSSLVGWGRTFFVGLKYNFTKY